MTDKIKFIILILCVIFLPACAHPQKKEAKEAIKGNKGYVGGGLPEKETSPVVEEEFWTRPLEYYVGTGDAIEISVWGISELSREITVRPDGKISYPLIGEVDVYGLTLPQLKDEMTKKLSMYVRQPNVTVILKQSGGNKIFVLGEVGRPGVYKYAGQMRLIEVISEAGGFTKDAVPRSVLVIRGDIAKDKNPRLIKVDVASIYSRAKLRNNILLQPNDVVFIPRSFISDVRQFFTDINQPLTSYLTTKTIFE